MSSSPTESSGDVKEFLKEIQGLSRSQVEEDELRNKMLEEEILQGRKERQARRAERARSISPTKSSPGNTPNTSRVSTAQFSNLSEATTPTIRPQAQRPPRDEAIEDATGSSTLPKEARGQISEDNEDPGLVLRPQSPSKSSPSTAMPSRSSLSWQRRPTSQTPRSRPLSMVATENAARSPRATPEPSPAPTEDAVLSREQIAQSLASKDPAWFRQTADRGANSPAYRRNQVEDEDRLEHGLSLSRVQMPGMSQNTSTSVTMPEDSVPSTSPAKPDAGSYRSAGFGSPLPLTSAQRFDPPSSDSRSEARGLAMSPAQGRISPERLDRPASPTKGMGGFVQSAMMKRSDSVNKRWSVQSPPGLSRGNSVIGNRSSHESNTPLSNVANATGLASRPSSLSRDNSPLPSSRPTSSHSTAPVAQEGRPGTTSPVKSSVAESTNSGDFAKPELLALRSAQHQDPVSIPKSNPQHRKSVTEVTPPTSPSKSVDTKRWSPTKSSWLESALNKPDSPKPKTTAPSQQPAWMSEINKAKQKASIDLGRKPSNTPKHEVSIGGLMRSPPPGSHGKTISVSGLPAGFHSGVTAKSRSESVTSIDEKSLSPQDESTRILSSVSTSTTKPTMQIKPKPETPPKKDFRANLKPRALPDVEKKDEPEFKNVFSQLRHTKTQNYVAPDELKNNITRGKAALNITGGPKKTERVDEFKEAILKKKEEFKKAQLEGKGVVKSDIAASSEPVLPEALAKRRALGKKDMSVLESKSSPSDSSSLRTDDAQPTASIRTPTPTLRKETGNSKLANRFNPALAGLLARGPPSMASETSRAPSSTSSQRTASVSTSTTAESSEPGPQLTHMTKSRARGPRRKAPSSVPSTSAAPEAFSGIDISVRRSNVPSSTVIEFTTPSETSLFKTKSLTSSPVKAVSPVSRQDEAENIPSQPSSPKKLDLKRRSQFLQESISKNNIGEYQLGSAKPLSPTKKVNMAETKFNDPSSRDVPESKPKPVTPIKSPSLAANAFPAKPKSSRQADDLRSYDSSGPDVSDVSANLPYTEPESLNKPELLDSKDAETGRIRPSPLSIRKSAFNTLPKDKKLPLTEIEHNLTEIERSQHVYSNDGSQTSASVKNAAASWDRPSVHQTVQGARAPSPIKLPTRDDEKAAMIGAGLRPSSPIKIIGQITSESGSSRPLPILPLKSQLSPPVRTPTKTINSPVTPMSEASTPVTDFFDTQSSPLAFAVDTGKLLAARPNQDTTITTLRSSLYQLSGDGKKQPVPSHQERLLFEGNMYICVHSFVNAGGKKTTEVYFWIGDEVPASTADEVTIFAQREARAAGGNLIKMQQGKESPEFFQALGGIIIIRRGSSSKYDSLAPHILCGRKHFGQIAFDEVDFSPASLCSGFPYLISTQSGKSYLWKGRGSAIDELSCARLIGMDFGVMGEIEEIGDGQEPASFLDSVFGNDAKIPQSANHWRMKPNYNKYCGRLFLANSTVQSQIVEITPFCQADVSPRNVYILDAFFEIYIIVGSKAQSQYPAFHNALTFAQEFSILAAGSEDRPYVPVTTVVLEGIPKDMKSVFRKWTEGLTPTIMRPMSPGLKRGRSLRVIPLNTALEATRKV
ncbi:hypothetical protein B0O99DRAFT_622184 [Bisporella sp. PMI_857]|nr:hypothetical protein B0O99DRAFT_622184 [Bisporella sp. PMI_857]